MNETNKQFVSEENQTPAGTIRNIRKNRVPIFFACPYHSCCILQKRRYVIIMMEKLSRKILASSSENP
jgi:hypothetical protein